MGLDLNELHRLTIAQLARIVDLRVTPNYQSEAIIDDVRDKVLWKRNAWNDPALRDSAIDDTANYLVPEHSRQRITEFFQITSAWDFVGDLRKAESVSADELSAIARQALFGAYRQAVRNLVDWAEERQNARNLGSSSR